MTVDIEMGRNDTTATKEVLAVDSEGLSLSDFPFTHEMVGINCVHAQEALVIAAERMKKLVENDASDDEMRAEMARTDPLYKAFVWIGIQRSAYAIELAMQGSWPVLEHLDLYGLGQSLTEQDFSDFHNKLWKPVADAFKSFQDQLEDRLEHLHAKQPDGSKTLVAWNYGDDNPSAQPVLDDHDTAVADTLLRSIFGGVTHEEESATHQSQTQRPGRPD